MKLCSLLLCASALLAAGKPVLKPVSLHQDFQENTLGQWTGYPPVQDAGYDPSLSPTYGYNAPGGRAMMRIVQPVSRTGFQVGFIRRMDLAAAANTRVSLSYLLKPARPGDRVEVGLAGADGRRYTASTVVTGQAWSQAAVRFPEIPAGTGIEAIYIQAVVAAPDPDLEYRFMIDNVTIDAAQAARFEVRKPSTTAIFPWPALVSGATYAPGQTIALEAAAPVRLTKAECAIKDQDGRVVASAPLTERGGIWANDALYTVRASDPTGVWRLELRGSAADGREVATEVRAIVRPPRSGAHPRLYFDTKSLDTLKARMQDPATAQAWSTLLRQAVSSRQNADPSERMFGTSLQRQAIPRGGADMADYGRMFTLFDPAHLLPMLQGYFSGMNRASSRLEYNALAAAVGGDPAARAAAKSALLAVSGWPTWAPPWFEAHGQHTYYPAGILSGAAAFAYDVAYPDLSADERGRAKAALEKFGAYNTYREYVQDNRIVPSTSNWISHTLSGGILAVAAVDDGDDDAKLNTWLGGLLLRLEDHMAATYLADGSYGEGISYMEFDLQTLTLALEALQRVYGIDYWSRTHVARGITYPMYLRSDPAHDTLDMGDSHAPRAATSAALVRHAADPALRWYYDQFPHTSITDFLFFPDNVKPSGPPAQVSRVFPDKGNVVFRSGWGAEDTILLFRAGPDYNHNHSDQGSFLIRSMGENLAVEGGPANYYDEPYYRTYFTQAAGHNTVLVDHDDASQDIADTRQFPAFNRHPRIVDALASNFHDAVGGELAPVYRGRLDRYTRRIVYLKPDYIVISDDLAARAPATFDWLLHVDDRAGLEASGQRALYRGKRAALDVRVLAAGGGLKIEDGPVKYTTFNTGLPAAIPPRPAVLHVSSGAAARTGRFLVVLAPGRTPEAATAAGSKVQAVSGTGCAGAQAGNAIAMFRDAGAAECRYKDIVTDAAAWSRNGDVHSLELATRLQKGTETVFESDRPVSIAVRLGSGGGEMVTDAAKPAHAKLQVNGRMVPLDIPAGQSTRKLP